MTKPSVAKTLVVEVGGQALQPALANTLVEGYIDDSRMLPDMFFLRFRDPSRTLLSQSGIRIGVEVRLLVGVGDGQSPQPMLTGEVTGLEVDIDNTGTFTIVRGLDRSHRLISGRRVTSYQNMTIADICAQVAQRAGLTVGKIDVKGPVLPHVAQPNVTDWEFIRSLAEDAGGRPYVADGKLNIAVPTPAQDAPDPSSRADQSPLVLELGSNMISCRAGVTAAEQVNEVEVRGWDVKSKRAVVGHASAGRASTLELATSPADVTKPFGQRRYVATDAVYGSQAEADQAAKAIAERIAGSFGELEAVIHGNPKVRAGQAVSLSGVGAPFEGRYTVTASRHVFDSLNGYQTWVVVSGEQVRSLFGSGGGGPGGPAGHTTGSSAGGARVMGLASATVTDTKDPDKLGRVRVTFPWLSDDYASDWVRVAQLGGYGGGGVFGPGVSDEVLVGFEQGRLDRPYVIAGLYNGMDKPSPHEIELIDGTSGAVNRRTFVSRSGNRVELLDAASGPQGVRLATGDGKLTINLDRKGTTIVVHSDGKIEIDAKQTISVKAGNGITVDAGNGALEMSGLSVKVSGRNGVEIDGGPAKVDVKGAQVSVNGSASTEIKAGASCAISASLVRIN